MPPRNARGRAKSLTGARRARGARRNLNEGDDHQESMMGGRASGAEFMQGVFTAIEQVVRNIVQTMQVPIRATENRATTAMKAFLQLRPPTFKGEPDPLVAEDWLEQITRALDTILVTEKELRVLFARDALQWWKTVEEVGAKKAKFTSLSRFAKAFVSTEEEKAKQFMQGLRPSIRNKIAGNLIKVYSTMVSSAAAIEETLNETRKIQNPKSQREGTSNHIIWPNIMGRADLFWLSSTGSSCYGLPTEGSAATVTIGWTISHPGTRTITSQGATYLLLVWSGWSYQSTVHAEGEQSGSYRITTYSVNSGLEGQSIIYINTTFISVQTTGYNLEGSKDAGAGLRYDVSSGTVRDS
ncbi:hypothetical protein Acr_29g0003230 [Actinidia rufa]|uniref:Retrotransposon gag domain-containing protein n=1 Tax=Actinidia rufa TaxID=165716 RepID=A0A7J0HDW4_9ERIC|nr:hypothetical protein Acr_29g0003230 [Actinidia rufa]